MFSHSIGSSKEEKWMLYLSKALTEKGSMLISLSVIFVENDDLLYEKKS